MQKFLEQEEEREGRKAEIKVKQREEKSKAMRQLLNDFQEQMERGLYELDDQVSMSSV